MCCLMGLLDYKGTLSGKQKSKMISLLGTAAELRGTDATGIAYLQNDKLCIYKKPIAAHKMRFRIPNSSKVVMGHTRLATQGSQKYSINNHPFPGYIENQSFALAHNGVIHNDVELRRTLHLPKTKIQTDSYIAVQMIEQQKVLNFESLRYMAEQVRGSFCFTVMDHREQLYFAKGDNPLCLYHFPQTGIYLYASTEEILKMALRKMHFLKETPISIEVRSGDILCVAPDGTITWSKFDGSHLFSQSYFHFGCFWETVLQEKDPIEELYLRELKSVAGYYGFSSDEIDEWLADGFSMEEIEDFLYSGCSSRDR